LASGRDWSASDALCTIARELVAAVKGNTTIDWAEKESVRAKLRLMVKRVLRRFGYPPDKQEKATRTVLEQAEVLSAQWGSEAVLEAEDLLTRPLYSARRLGPTRNLGAVAERQSTIGSDVSADGEPDGQR
jgi:hypothetical protein